MSYRYEPKDEALRAEYNEIKNSPRKAERFAEQLLNNDKYEEISYICTSARDTECENMYEAVFLNQAIGKAEERKANRRRTTDLFAYDLQILRNKIDDEIMANNDFEERDKDCTGYLDMLEDVCEQLREVQRRLDIYR